MFTLKIDGQSYGVRVQYRPVYLDEKLFGSKFFTEDPPTPTGDRLTRNPDSTRTVVQILKLNDEARTSELVVEGSATCTLADKFVKREGRERAFKKAVNAFSSFKTVRTALWDAYWANHKHGKKVSVPASCEFCLNVPVVDENGKETGIEIICHTPSIEMKGKAK